MADVINKIDGGNIALAISTNLVTPAWKEVVCGETAGLDGSTDTTTRKTKCGTITQVTPTTWTVTGSGVALHTVESDEISADDLLSLIDNNTPVLWKLYDSVTPANYYRQSSGTFSAYSEDSGVDDPVSFDFTLAVDGTIDLVP